ncbi:MAG: secretin and TonB N-terminal domain-containing protein [Opitutales bacterium]|nr:secretin and TonB N-terminal domain-containing protein [Opitutales bacterium]
MTKSNRKTTRLVSVARRALLLPLVGSIFASNSYSQVGLYADITDPIERARLAVTQNDERVNDPAIDISESGSSTNSGSVRESSYDNDPSEETISLNVDDQEIRVILRNIAELFELNIVIPEDLQGRTSLNLRDVTWQQVFNIVLSEQGYSWSEVGGIIRIRQGIQAEEGGDPRVTDLGEGRLKVDFRATPVNTIISLVADELDLNVVIPPDEALSSELDLRLNGVTWDQVYEVALAQFGYGYIDNDGIVLVRSLDQINGVPDEARVFQIKYSDAESVAELLKEQAGVTRVVTDPRSNVIIITGNPSRFTAIKSLIETLDRPTPQVMIESRFVEVSNSDISQIGVDWKSLFSEDGYTLEGSYRSETDRTRNKQESLTDNSTSDFNNTNTRTGTPPVSATDSTIESTINQVRNLLDSTVANRTDTAIFNAPSFDLVLRALKQLNDSKIISNPTVLALNGQEAVIKIVDHYYVQEPGTVSEDGRVVPGEVIRLDPLPGIELQVTPTISGGDFIGLKVVPQVNDIVGSQSFSNGTIPIVRQRTTLTQVMVKDRETLAIGGLIDESTSTQSQKVPLLGSVPGLGRLFRYDREVSDSQNQIIFITASILNPNETNYVDVVGVNRLNDLGLTDRDVMGSNYPLSAEERALNEAIMQHRRRMDAEEREGKLSVQLEAYRELERRQAEEALRQLEKESDFSFDSGEDDFEESAMSSLKNSKRDRVVPVF